MELPTGILALMLNMFEVVCSHRAASQYTGSAKHCKYSAYTIMQAVANVFETRSAVHMQLP